MKHVNLFCTVGRAEPQALASFDYANPDVAEKACDAVQATKFAELLQSGVAPNRITFEREVVENPDETKTAPRGAKGRR